MSKQNHTWTCLVGRELGEMRGQCFAIVAHENTTLMRGELENLGVRKTAQSGPIGIKEINSRCKPLDTSHNARVKVGVSDPPPRTQARP